MTYPLENDEAGLIRFGSRRRRWGPCLSARRSWPWGLGLGESAEIRDLVRWVLETVTLPTVLDADALNARAGQTDAPWPISSDRR